MQALSDGNRIVHHSTGRVCRDAEGRVRREEDRPSGPPSISITDPVAGFSYSLNPETHVAMKTPAFAGTIIMNKLDEMKTTLKAQVAGGRVETRAVEPGALTLSDGWSATTVEFVVHNACLCEADTYRHFQRPEHVGRDRGEGLGPLSSRL